METPPPPPPTDEQAADYPQKRFFRSRAHCNPLSHNDAAPYLKTIGADWAGLYPTRDASNGSNIAFRTWAAGLAVWRWRYRHSPNKAHARVRNKTEGRRVREKKD